MRVQWYPGHMARSKREMESSLSSVDAVAELVDARVPRSSRNPALTEMIRSRQKPHMIILNHTDQADPSETKRWAADFREKGYAVVECDAKLGAGVKAFVPAVKELLSEKIARAAAKGQARPMRVMVVGIPNIGKSSFINRLCGRRAAKAEDRPGVTRIQQWVKLDTGVELLDTPGMLAPKIIYFEDGLHLAFTGAVRDDILDIETLGAYLLQSLIAKAPGAVLSRLKLEPVADEEKYASLERAARGRGFLLPGNEADLERAARVILDEYRAGLFGRLTLESAGERAKPNSFYGETNA